MLGRDPDHPKGLFGLATEPGMTVPSFHVNTSYYVYSSGSQTLADRVLGQTSSHSDKTSQGAQIAGSYAITTFGSTVRSAIKLERYYQLVL